MLFSCSVGYRATASKLLFGQSLQRLAVTLTHATLLLACRARRRPSPSWAALSGKRSYTREVTRTIFTAKALQLTTGSYRIRLKSS